MENVLEIKSLRKEYKGFALNDVSFQLPYGYIMGLIGPNGAGKTTIIKLLMNLINKKSGEIKLFGKDNLKNEIEVKERIGFVYDTNCFYENLSLEKMKNIIAPFYKQWDDEQFYKYIKMFELPLKKKIKTLSKGMHTKYVCAIALSHHAELIILDEPTSGLDPVFRREFLEILSEIIQNKKKSIIFSSHITTDLERIADYITFIKNGNIIFSDTKDNILENWVIVKGAKEELTETAKTVLKGIRNNDFGFEGLAADRKIAEETFSNKAVIEKATLEDIMFFIVKGENHV